MKIKTFKIINKKMIFLQINFNIFKKKVSFQNLRISRNKIRKNSILRMILK
jgi:hypothetical protein